MRVETVRPKTTAVPIGLNIAAPSPDMSIIGTIPKIVVIAVMRMELIAIFLMYIKIILMFYDNESIIR